MSTKAIREALEAAGMAAPDTSNEDLARKVAAAWSEVEAIELAAKTIAVQGVYELPSDSEDYETARAIEQAEAIMESIAKEAP